MKMSSSSAMSVQMRSAETESTATRSSLTSALRTAGSYATQVQMLAPEANGMPDPVSGRLGTMLATLAKAMLGQKVPNFTAYDHQTMKWPDALALWTGELDALLAKALPADAPGVANLKAADLLTNMPNFAPVSLERAQKWAMNAIGPGFDRNGLIVAWGAAGGG